MAQIPKRNQQRRAEQAPRHAVAQPHSQRSVGINQIRPAQAHTPAPTTRHSAGRWRSSFVSLVVAAIVALGLVTIVHAVASNSSGGGTPTAVSGFGGANSGAAGGSTVASGKLAPAFTLTTLSGASFSLASAHGHPVVLYFMATTCDTCVAGSQGLAQAVQSAHVAGAQAVAIDVNAGDSRSELAAFVQATGVPTNAPVVWGVDTNDRITQAYGVLTLETTVVINAQGYIAYENPGSVDPKQLAQIIQKAA